MEKRYEIVTMYIEMEKVFAGTYAECMKWLSKLAILNGNVNSNGEAIMRFWGNKDAGGERVDVGESIIYLVRPEQDITVTPYYPNRFWDDDNS